VPCGAQIPVLVSFTGAEAPGDLRVAAGVDRSRAGRRARRRPLAQLDDPDPGMLVEPPEDRLVARRPAPRPRSRPCDLLQVVPVDRDGIALGSHAGGDEPLDEEIVD